MFNLPHYRSITVTFYGATTHKGARIKISDHRQKESIFLPYDYQIGDINIQAYNVLTTFGWNVVGFTSDDNNTTFICDNWDANFLSVKNITK